MKVRKTTGHTEEFDADKLFRSVHAACESVMLDAAESQSVARNVVDAVQEGLGSEDEVHSQRIRELVGEHLRDHDEELHFSYDRHVPNLRRL